MSDALFTMFVCQHCNHHGFELVLHPSVRDKVTLAANEHGDIVITVGTQHMVADLAFMNQFATCSHCGARKQWAYASP
ncbi:MAG: hypothetical protein U0003_04425 [Vampirovibrionales bacterium]